MQEKKSKKSKYGKLGRLASAGAAPGPRYLTIVNLAERYMGVARKGHDAHP